MKRIFGIAFLSLIICYSCTNEKKSSEKKNDLTYSGLNGKVKSVETEIYKLIPEKDTFRVAEKIDGFSVDRNSSFAFNEFGNLTYYKEFDAAGKPRKEQLYAYDAADRLIKRSEIDYYGKGNQLDYELEYDDNDSIKQVIISNNEYKRIDNIQRNEELYPTYREFVVNDTIVSSYEAIYDDNNNLITENEYGYNKSPFRIVKRTFNGDNLKISEEVQEFKNLDTIQYRNEFTYDDAQNLTVAKYNIRYDSIYMEIQNTYHANGKLKQKISTPVGSRFQTVTIQKFDEEGQMIEFSRIPKDTTETQQTWLHTFTYDAQKNWIQRVDYEGEKPLKMVKRTITYYE